MAKRIALLISLVMMLSFSCVFATETLAAPAPAETDVVEVVSGDETVENVSGEVEAPVSGEAVEEVSGDDEVEAPVSGEAVEEVSGEETEAPADTTQTPADAEDAEEGNSSVVGAVIAIVIVVAIVAIVCVLKKK